MILREHVEHHKRLASLGAFDGDMLLLGEHTSRLLDGTPARTFFARLGAASVTTLDPDGGEIRADLNADLSDLSQAYDSVFNLGTIEHVWNVHHAWANALRAVRTGGMFASHSPALGFSNHGIHVTGAKYIIAFVKANGFRLLDAWMSHDKDGVALWLVACKERHIECLNDFASPQQVYRQGRKSLSSVYGGMDGLPSTAATDRDTP